MVVRIGACRCLARVLPQAQQEERRKVLAAVYKGVSDMLPEVGRRVERGGGGVRRA